MIKEIDLNDLDNVLKIWLETNLEAHNFIPKKYWIQNFDLVKEMLPSAEIYVFEEDNVIKGFVGIMEQSYIAGIFVKKEYQKEGIGSKLIEYCKSKYPYLTLDVFIKNRNSVNFYLKNNFKVLNKHINKETEEIEYTMSFDEK